MTEVCLIAGLCFTAAWILQAYQLTKQHRYIHQRIQHLQQEVLLLKSTLLKHSQIPSREVAQHEPIVNTKLFSGNYDKTFH